jgi:hypothetical protein
MASLMTGPTLEEAKQLPQNNKSNRVKKMRALSEFIPQNAVDQDGDAFHGSGGIFENFNGYNAVVQKQIIAEAIAIIDAAQQQQQGVYQPQSPTYSPTTPLSMSRQSSMSDVDMDMDEPLHINIPSSNRSRNVSTKEDDSGRRSPDIVLEEAAQNHALTIPVETNVFLPYQRRVIEAIRQIEQMRPTDLPGAQARELRRVIQVVYEVFFGVDYTTGNPTAFYQEHGAAPIAGMNPAQLTQQATQARQAQAVVNQRAEDSLGFLTTFLQPLFNRANDPTVAAAFTASWQQQGANTNIAAPLNDITRLMTAVQNIHIAGAHLVRSDPLFIANRHERVQQGDLRVRNWYERIGYWIALNGYASFRDYIVANFPRLGPQLATRMDAVMPAAYRSSHLAIQQFEAALREYNTIYQRLPPWARLCWTLPYPPGPPSTGYNQAVTRSLNKPGSEELQHAGELAQRGDREGALQMLADARGDVLNHPASTYPAFLTLTSGGQVNGPLIAYYYALHGGRMLYQQEGQQWLTDAFNSNPGRFIQEMANLVDTMEEMHRQYQASGGNLGEGFYGQNQAWLNATQALESRNPQTRQQAAARVSQAFGTGQVGTISSGGIAHMCKPGGGGSSSMCESMRGTMRRTFNPQQSTQMGSEPLYGNQVVSESGDGKQSSRAFRHNVAQQQSQEVGAIYAQGQRNLAGEQVTTRFLEGLRTDYAGGNRGDQYWTTEIRQSTNNPEETITTPGVLEILNIRVHLYAPVPSPPGRPVSPRQQHWAALPRDQAGVGSGPGLRLWQLLVRNLNGFRNINNPDELLHRLGQVGTGIVWAARQGTGLDGFNNPAFRMRADEVRNIALQMLQNPLLRSIIHVVPDAQSGSTYTQNSASRAIHDINAQGGKKRGGRRTRKHKKRRKKTRRHRHHRKKTRHKKKKRTRKH